MSQFVFIFFILTGILTVTTTAKADDRSRSSEELQPLKLIKIRRLVHFLQETEASKANPPESSGESLEIRLPKDDEDDKKEPATEAEAPVAPKVSRHRSSHKSAAGGCVIIGGLVTAIFAAVYCYIRVTRKQDGEKY